VKVEIGDEHHQSKPTYRKLSEPPATPPPQRNALLYISVRMNNVYMFKKNEAKQSLTELSEKSINKYGFQQISYENIVHNNIDFVFCT
jgi:hypothetical protein